MEENLKSKENLNEDFVNKEEQKVYPYKPSDINLDKLIPFENHPFTSYEGQRFLDMVESIKANGVLTPIIVRIHPRKEGEYEILSGHNRVNAAREAGVHYIPAIIKKGITDDEALLIVTETNLMQRSFADLKHSERAIIIATHYDAMKKKPGYRSDLVKEMEDIMKGAPVGHRNKTRDKIGEQFSLGKTSVMRYLQINRLIPELKAKLDDNIIGMRVAESLSQLREKEQRWVDKIISDNKKISIKQSDELKEKSKVKELTFTAIQELLKQGKPVNKLESFKLSKDFLSKHFKDNQSEKEIADIIEDALSKYFANHS